MVQLATPAHAARWLAAHVSGTLRSDSRAVRSGDGFLAWPGQASDGRRFVPAALAAGASACLVEADGAADFNFSDPRIATLTGLKASAGLVADIFFGQPSARLDIVASTGTNGKTSTAWWTAQALTALGRRCGVMGTLGIGEPPRARAPDAVRDEPAADGLGTVQSTGLTTPDAVHLHAALRAFADQRFSACALEASSIGLVEHRLAGARIAVALFTNLTRDHLDHHGDMAAYWAAKRALFSWPGLRAAVVNIDDEHGARLAAELSGTRIDLWTVSVGRPARLVASHLHYGAAGLTFDLSEGPLTLPVATRLVGDHNVSNLLNVIGGLRALGVSLPDAVRVVAGLTPVPGRLQRLQGEVEVVVDYAHTPDALDKVLQALRPLAAARGGRLWCVFGCGGNRDAGKRPLMGAIAERGADRVVLTSDNPRHEQPGEILKQILAGLSNPAAAEVVEDRRAAIAQAVAEASPGDVLLLAGKGHEDYQEVAGVQRPFSDVAEARRALALRSPPLPLAGEGWGEGLRAPLSSHPHPNPLPPCGRGGLA